MIVKTQIEQMIENVKTLVAFVKEPKVIKCGNPIGVDIEDSDNPNIIILDGTVKKEDFELAKGLIPEGGVIAFTRGNAGVCKSMKEAEELYGESWLIAIDAINAGEYITNIRNILVYVKGASNKYDIKGNDWATFKANYQVIQMHNFKAAYKNMSFIKLPYNLPSIEETEITSNDKIEVVDVQLQELKEKAKEYGIKIGRSGKESLKKKIEDYEKENS